MVDSEPPVLLFLGRVANPELFLGFPFSHKLSKFAAETRGTRNIFRPDQYLFCKRHIFLSYMDQYSWLSHTETMKNLSNLCILFLP